jgi:hypothetical protein
MFRPKQIPGSYMAVDDPSAANPVPKAPAKPHDTFTIGP